MISGNKYNNASSMRMALEERLKILSKNQGSDVMRLRRQVAFDRFLARLFNNPLTDLVVKGGYILELRIQNARSTKDIDFSINSRLISSEHDKSKGIQSFLQERLSVDLGDFHFFYCG